MDRDIARHDPIEGLSCYAFSKDGELKGVNGTILDISFKRR